MMTWTSNLRILLAISFCIPSLPGDGVALRGSEAVRRASAAPDRREALMLTSLSSRQPVLEDVPHWWPLLQDLALYGSVASAGLLMTMSVPQGLPHATNVRWLSDPLLDTSLRDALKLYSDTTLARSNHFKGSHYVRIAAEYEYLCDVAGIPADSRVLRSAFELGLSPHDRKRNGGRDRQREDDVDHLHDLIWTPYDPPALADEKSAPIPQRRNILNHMGVLGQKARSVHDLLLAAAYKLVVLSEVADGKTPYEAEICGLLERELFEVYAPLFERLGATQLAGVVQEKTFIATHPKQYSIAVSQLQTLLGTSLDDAHQQANVTVAAISEALKTAPGGPIKAEVFGRVKSPYSFWMKKIKKKRPLSDIGDPFAFSVNLFDPADLDRAVERISGLFDLKQAEMDEKGKPKKRVQQKFKRLGDYDAVHFPFMRKIGDVEVSHEVQVFLGPSAYQEYLDGPKAHWAWKLSIALPNQLYNFSPYGMKRDDIVYNFQHWKESLNPWTYFFIPVWEGRVQRYIAQRITREIQAGGTVVRGHMADIAAMNGQLDGRLHNASVQKVFYNPDQSPEHFSAHTQPQFKALDQIVHTGDVVTLIQGNADQSFSWNEVSRKSASPLLLVRQAKMESPKQWASYVEAGRENFLSELKKQIGSTRIKKKKNGRHGEGQILQDAHFTLVINDAYRNAVLGPAAMRHFMSEEDLLGALGAPQCARLKPELTEFILKLTREHGQNLLRAAWNFTGDAGDDERVLEAARTAGLTSSDDLLLLAGAHLIPSDRLASLRPVRHRTHHGDAAAQDSATHKPVQFELQIINPDDYPFPSIEKFLLNQFKKTGIRGRLVTGRRRGALEVRLEEGRIPLDTDPVLLSKVLEEDLNHHFRRAGIRLTIESNSLEDLTPSAPIAPGGMEIEVSGTPRGGDAGSLVVRTRPSRPGALLAIERVLQLYGWEAVQGSRSAERLDGWAETRLEVERDRSALAVNVSFPIVCEALRHLLVPPSQAHAGDPGWRYSIHAVLRRGPLPQIELLAALFESRVNLQILDLNASDDGATTRLDLVARVPADVSVPDLRRKLESRLGLRSTPPLHATVLEIDEAEIDQATGLEILEINRRLENRESLDHVASDALRRPGVNQNFLRDYIAMVKVTSDLQGYAAEGRDPRHGLVSEPQIRHDGTPQIHHTLRTTSAFMELFGLWYPAVILAGPPHDLIEDAGAQVWLRVEKILGLYRQGKRAEFLALLEQLETYFPKVAMLVEASIYRVVGTSAPQFASLLEDLRPVFLKEINAQIRLLVRGGLRMNPHAVFVNIGLMSKQTSEVAKYMRNLAERGALALMLFKIADRFDNSRDLDAPAEVFRKRAVRQLVETVTVFLPEIDRCWNEAGAAGLSQAQAGLATVLDRIAEKSEAVGAWDAVTSETVKALSAPDKSHERQAYVSRLRSLIGWYSRRLSDLPPDHASRRRKLVARLGEIVRRLNGPARQGGRHSNAIVILLATAGAVAARLHGDETPSVSYSMVLNTPLLPYVFVPGWVPVLFVQALRTRLTRAVSASSEYQRRASTLISA